MLRSEFALNGASMPPLLAALGVLLGITLLHIVLSALARRWAAQPKPGQAEHERRARSWLVHGVFWARPAIAALVWIYAVHFALVQVVKEFTANDGRWAQVIPALDWVRGVLVLAALFWLLLRIGRFIEARLAALAQRTESKVDDIVAPLAGKAIRAVLPLLAIVLGVPALEVSPETRTLLGEATSLLIIGTVAFLLFQAVDALQAYVLQQYRVDVQDNYRARGIQTQVLMLKRVAVVVIGVITLASMLMVFESVRRFGTTILASAGVAGIVVGFAAQKSLGTLLAGFQIALTQPFRIDDVVIVENEWGRIEEITLTYVVVDIWDMRRLVVPITYFLEKPFQNWTRTTAQLLGTIFLYVDYNVRLDDLRAQFERVVKASPRWDGRVCGLQVTDAKERCIEVRGLVSAADSSRAWDLRCEVREKMLVWLAAQSPQALPQTRIHLEPEAGSRHPRGDGPTTDAPAPLGPDAPKSL